MWCYCIEIQDRGASLARWSKHEANTKPIDLLTKLKQNLLAKFNFNAAPSVAARESGALRRLPRIMANYPPLSTYVQCDAPVIRPVVAIHQFDTNRALQRVQILSGSQNSMK
jgi:hypothetical protein